jgi:hypothetical protein
MAAATDSPHRPAARQPWQFMDSAPKDGTRIMLFRPLCAINFKVTIGRWQDGPPARWHCEEGPNNVGAPSTNDPTHWMPMPVPATGQPHP